MIGLFETTGPNGEKEVSSMWVFGGALIVLGALLQLALGVVSFFIVVADPGTIQTVSAWMLSVGGGLLGIGVLEGIGRPRA